MDTYKWLPMCVCYGGMVYVKMTEIEGLKGAQKRCPPQEGQQKKNNN